MLVAMEDGIYTFAVAPCFALSVWNSVLLERPASNRFSALVQWWYPQRQAMRWVLASLFDTRGSVYRKSGAQLLINDLGQWFGLISGGCLEAEIVRLAQRVFADGEPREHVFDPQQFEEGVTAEMGCGGTLTVRLQALNAINDYLDLSAVHAAIVARQSGHWWQSTAAGEAEAFWQPDAQRPPFSARATTQMHAETQWLVTPLDLPPHVLLIGGGVDARPLAAIAQILGWRVSVCDPRVSAARVVDFHKSVNILSHLPENLLDVDAAVVMTHNLSLDSDALCALQRAPSLRYLALLGPPHRRDAVLVAAGLNAAHFSVPLAGPAGLKLGGDLPESVALSILAEAHAALYDACGESFCRLLSPAGSAT